MVALQTVGESAPSAFARAYRAVIEAGFHPLAIEPGHKRPGSFMHGRWFPAAGWQAYCDVAPDDALIAKMAKWPNAGIGIALGSRVGEQIVIALDFDTTDPGELAVLLEAVPESPMIKVGEKGETLFYRADPSIVSRAYKIDGRGILDLLAKGKPTVVPPTRHPSGVNYRWKEGCGVIPACDLPIFTAAHLAALESELRRLGWQGVEMAGAPTDAAGGPLRAAGHDDDDPAAIYFRETNEAALANLSAWVHDLGLATLRTKCGGFEAVAEWRPSSTGRPLAARRRNLSLVSSGIVDFGDGPKGYTPIDLVMAATGRTLDEATAFLRQKLDISAGDIKVLSFDHQMAERERCVVEAPDGTWHDMRTGEVLSLPAVNDNEELPEHLTMPPGLLGNVTQWIVDTARSPNRVLALGAAITVIGTLAGRRDGGPTNSGTALYVLCLGPSGCGKQHGLDQIQRLMHAAGAGDLIGSGEAMSSTAVWRQLQRKPLSISPMDEFGDYLKRINSRKAASHEAGIAPVLRKAWGVPFSAALSPSWAGLDSEQVHCLALSIYAVATPHQFYSALSNADMENGTLNRFLILPTMTDAEEDNPADAFAVPEDIADGLVRLYERGRDFPAPGVQLPSANPITPEPVPWAQDGAEVLFKTFRGEVKALRNANPETADCYARTVEMALRLATIVAVGRSLENPTVSAEDFTWGRDLAIWSSRKLARDAGERVSDTPTGALWSKIVVYLRRSGGQCDHTRLSKHMNLTPREFREAVAGAEDAGLIDPPIKVPRSDGRPGKPKTIYRLPQNNRTAS